jgi:hypothetical protein
MRYRNERKFVVRAVKKAGYSRTFAHSSYSGVASKIVAARCSKWSVVGTPTTVSGTA